MLDLRRLGLLLIVYTFIALVSPGSSIVNPRPKPTYQPDFVFPSVPEHDRRRLPVWGLCLYDHSTGSSNQRLKRQMQPTRSVFQLESTDRASVEGRPRAARAKITPRKNSQPAVTLNI